MDNLKEKITNRIKKTEEKKKKQLALILKTETINNLDLIAKCMTKISGKCSTRNALIEDALEAYIEESIKLLKTEGITDLEEFIVDDNDFDTVIFPAHYEGFNNVFLNEAKWYYVRINSERFNKLKYIGIYVGNPIQAITHYGEIKEFEYNENEKKYIIHLKDEPIELSNPIPLKNTNPNATRAPRYTTLEKLLSASEFKDLF